MRDDQTAATRSGDAGKKPSALSQWASDLATRKVGVGTVVVFIGLLGVFCLMASGIGYLVHHMRVH
jgi:hypothetical protein